MPPKNPGWHVVHNKGGGDCLFHAVAQALNTTPALAGNKTVNALQLRALVATSILQAGSHGMPHGRAARNALTNWMQMLSAGLSAEAPHASGVYPHWLKQRGKFTTNDLAVMQRAMLNRDLYWGDEYAIGVIERHFGCALLIYDSDMQRQGHAVAHVPRFYIPLQLCNANNTSGAHYTLLTYNGASILNSIPK